MELQNHPDDEVYGTPEQQRLIRRGLALDRLLRQDPRFSCHGRPVGIDACPTDLTDLLALAGDLAQLQGIAPCENVPVGDADALVAAFGDRGMKTDRYLRYEGGKDCFVRARDVVQSTELPSDLSLHIIDRHAPRDWLGKMYHIASSADVVLPAGAMLRGIARPGVGMILVDGSGAPVACAGSVASHHPNSPRAGMAHWGLLATRPDWRGQGIGRLLGAMVMIHMQDHARIVSVCTGVRADNVASDALCRGLNVRPSDREIVIGIDPAAMSGDQLTK